MSKPYLTEAPTRADIEALPGTTVLEFGTDWCAFCQAAQDPIQAALAQHPGIRHIKVEDGAGRALGRSFGVKLWPTLVLLQDGQQQDKLVRPTHVHSVEQALRQLDTNAAP